MTCCVVFCVFCALTILDLLCSGDVCVLLHVRLSAREYLCIRGMYVVGVWQCGVVVWLVASLSVYVAGDAAGCVAACLYSWWCVYV